jgi:hypothetical protein
MTIQLQDASGNLTPAVVDTVVALSSSSPIAVFRDLNDSTNISFITTLAGASSASFRYRDTAVGSVLITAAATGFTSATQQLTLVASGSSTTGSAPGPLPTSLVPPPNTPAPPFFLTESPLLSVSFSYFGPSAIVLMLTVPVQRSQTFETGCWSGPNATGQETGGAILWGMKPAGTQFVYFFVRGTRSYVFDTSYGNYCWVDLTPSA